MSVILDALRRARRPSPPGPVATPSPGVPAGLRVGAPRAESRAPGQTKWPLLVIVIAAAVVIWGGLRYGPRFLQRDAPALSAPAAVSTPVEATGPHAPRSDAERAAPPDQPEAAAPSLSEMVERVTEPSPVAPRAMPGARPADGTDAAAASEAPYNRRASAADRSPGIRSAGFSGRAASSRPAQPVSPPPPAVDHFGLAVKYHGLGNFAQALTHYEAVLLEDEFNVEARNNLGLLYHDRGLTGEAIEQFRRAILINPQYLRARGNLAVVLMNAGRLAEARAELRAALAIDPRNADLLVNMALVEKADEQPDAAIELLLRALGEQPFHAAAHYNLAVLYDEAGERGRAQDHYSEFLAHAGPEHGERLSAVRRRVEELAPDLPRQPYAAPR